MGRIFSIIAVVSSLMIICASGGTYWFSSLHTDKAKREAVASIVSNLAVNLSQEITTLQVSVDGLARSADVIAAFASGRPETIAETAAKLQSVVPYSLRVRLLMPDVNNLDESQVPYMGFGDLEMVRATLTGQPKPVIQGDAKDRHLAITSAVKDGGRVIGVVLASIDADLPKQLVLKTQLNNGLVKLKQDRLILATKGEAHDIDELDPISVPVLNTRWTLESWVDVRASVADMAILGSLVTIPVLLACLGYFIGYRKLREFFRQDQSSILKAAKNMIQGKHGGNYPMRLEEMQPIIAAMSQFTRVINQGGEPGAQSAKEADTDDFFDESFDLGILEEVSAGSSEQFETVAVTAPVIPEPPAAAPKTKRKLVAESPDLGVEAGVGAKTLSAAAPVKLSPVEQVFHRYGISGVAGKELNQDFAGDIGRAFASEAKEADVKTIVVARDGRASSEAIAQGLIDGIVSTGCNVIDLGIVPTPVLCFVAHHTDGRSGVMVTGGDLPAEYNGFKMLLRDQALTDEQIQSLKARIENNDYSLDAAGSSEQNNLFSNEYIGIMSEEVHIVRPMTVVLDCSNGAASQLGPMLLKTIGCDLIELNCDIDGQFPGHAPDPSESSNLVELMEAVKQHKADVGIMLNGDGDRMGLVDSAGRIVWPDRQAMIFVRDVLTGKPASEIIYDAGCSKHLPEKIKKHAGFPVLAKSGCSHLQARLKESGAAFATDVEGHFLFNDRWFGFADGLYAAVRIIEILSADMRQSSELFNELPNTLGTPQMRIPMSDSEAPAFIEQLFSKARFNDVFIVDVDGLRAEFPDGWGLARASNTLPGLEVRFEADTKEVMRRIQSEFKSLMQQIKPDISLPF